MEISAKARYGLAALVLMAQSNEPDECVKLISLSDQLKISKIYLEQVFSLLKRGSIVTSIKGAQGGYHLARTAKEITVFDILFSIETPLFKETDPTVEEGNEFIERAMKEIVFDGIDSSMKDFLRNISLEHLAAKAKSFEAIEPIMYYI